MLETEKEVRHCIKMKQEIDPKQTSRALAFELWMKSPMPMVTLVKTFDVTRLRRASRRQGLKFNMPFQILFADQQAPRASQKFLQHFFPHSIKLIDT